MEKYIGILESIGVNKNGATLYLALLEHGEKSISELTLLSWLYRMEVYRQLPLMREYGLILEVNRGKRKKYIAANPLTIQDLYSQKQEENSIHIKKLLDQYSYLNKKPRVMYQEWKKWVSAVFSDIVNSLSKWDIFYRISSEKDVEKANHYLPKNYRENRDKKQLERYVIMPEATAKSKLPRLERELVSIPKEFDEFEDNISLTLYGNKIAYIDFSSETSIIIEHKQLADFHKKMFQILYKTLKK